MNRIICTLNERLHEGEVLTDDKLTFYMGEKLPEFNRHVLVYYGGQLLSPCDSNIFEDDYTIVNGKFVMGIFCCSRGHYSDKEYETEQERKNNCGRLKANNPINIIWD